jgi:hypothetical protein
MKLPIFQIPVTLCAAIFFVSLAGCDGQPKNKPTYYIPQVIKDYCIFKDSSYWIYRDSITGNLDSQSLASTLNQILDNRRLNYKSEMFYADISSTYYGDLIMFQTYISDPQNCTFEDYYLQSILFHSDTVPGKKHHFTNTDYYIFLGPRDTMTVAGRQYKHIFEVTTNSKSYRHRQNRIFLSRHVGIIKYTTTDGHIWELVRCNVKQQK